MAWLPLIDHSPATLTKRAQQQFQQFYEEGNAHALLLKQGGTPTLSRSLAGRLYCSKSGWLLLSVPNALARGVFDALHETGAELPTKDGRFNAHISVMDADEVQKIGGPEKIDELGHTFRYTLGALKTVEPETWEGVSRVWYVTVDSPELRELRKSYGLEPLRKGFASSVCLTNH